METIRLTTLSHGSGCGCKIAPAVLESIIRQVQPVLPPSSLLVGNATRDDAAVYDLGDGKALIATTDFFTPIVDDPFDFGYIAAANAISDIYAMGGTPVMAIAILGWPVEKLPAEVAGQVMNGGQQACQQAGIPLAGGHSIDSPEPFFGLAVNGLIDTACVKTNATAKEGDLLFLTKPLGTGLLSTAQKRGKADPAHTAMAVALMKQLNTVGKDLSALSGVHAMTDITGFGLLGHLIEVCENAQLTAQLQVASIPTLPEEVLRLYLDQYTIPDNTYRNFNSYGHKVSEMTTDQLHVYCDPQTNGGLLIAVDPTAASMVQGVLQAAGLPHQPIGRLTAPGDKVVELL